MRKLTIILLGANAGAIVVALLMHWLSSFPSEGKHLTVQLTRGSLTLFDFPSQKRRTAAVLIFGSGDGGWGGLEEAVGNAFANQGYELVGINSQVYAQTDYNLETLQADYRTIAKEVLGHFGTHPPPLIVGGYSMGAAQAIAVAGGSHPPPGLIGLLLVDPLSRGRYGLRTSDRMDVLPQGPGTFAVDEFAKRMDSLRVVQWHAANDSIDSQAWLDSLTAEHREYNFPNTGHTYDTDRSGFIRRLVESTGWILNPATRNAMALKRVTP
jgi:phosphatidylglycerol lysyltransferase